MQKQPSLQTSPLAHYGLPFVLVGLGFVLRWLLSPILAEQAPLLVFVMPVVFSAWFGGLLPGILATLLSALVGSYVFIQPSFSLAMISSADLLRVVIFFLEGVAISLLSGAFHASRKRTLDGAERLQQSEQHFRTLADAMPQIVWTARADGSVDYYNRRWTEYSGVSQSEGQGWGWQPVLHPEDEARTLDVWAAAVRAGQTYEIEHRIRQAGGTFRWLLSRGVPSYNNKGEVARWFGTATDIHDQKHTEEALRDSEARYRLVLEQVKDYAIFMIDEAGKIVTWNLGAERILGYRGEEIIGQPISVIFTPEDRESSEDTKELETAVSQGQARDDRWHLRKDGSRFWASGVVTALHDPNGQLRGLVKVMRDNTERKRTEDALRESEGRFRSLFSSAPLGIVAVDEAGHIIMSNPALEHMFGYGKGELFDQLLEVLLPERLRAAHAEHRQDFAATPHERPMGLGMSLWGRRKDGSEFPLEASLSGIQLSEEKLAVAFIVDIAERERAEEGMRQRAKQQSVVAELGQQALAGTGLQDLMDRAVAKVAQTLEAKYCEVLELLPGNEALLLKAGVGWPEGFVGVGTVGTNADSQVGYTLRAKEPVIVEDLRTETRFSGLPLLRAHGVVSGLSVVIQPQGHAYGVFAAYTTQKRTFTEDDVNFMQAVANILAEAIGREQLTERLAYQAQHDPLTGLPNRTLMEDRLHQAMAWAQRHDQGVAFVLLDLDDFKRINDSLGHSAGDALLKEVAMRLKGCLREGDTVIRLGGDEFVLILPLTGEQDVTEIPKRILRILAPPFTLEGQDLFIGTSIGISLFPHDGADIEVLLREADAAMYGAKWQGKNRYQFYAEAMNAEARERLTLETELYRAVEQGQFVLYYQPRVNLASGRLTGAEALLRWQHPRLGLVAPAQFIPLTEQLGLISEIGAWVLAEACHQVRAWQEGGHADLKISVNLSAQQFQDRNLVQVVTGIITETGLQSDRLALEITENMLVKDVEEAIQQMHELKRLEGLQIAIDDFGIGYSSLSYLKRFPVDVLKIDKSFVDDIDKVGDAASGAIAIAKTIMSLAQNLGLTVVAEGVETPQQLHLLRALGCHEAQGYLIGRPLPAEAFEQLLGFFAHPPERYLLERVSVVEMIESPSLTSCVTRKSLFKCPRWSIILCPRPLKAFRHQVHNLTSLPFSGWGFTVS